MRLRNALIIAGALALGGIGYSFAQVVPQPGPPTPIAGAYNTTPPTLTDGQAGWAQLDSGGKLLTSSTFTPSGTQNVNLTQILSAAPSLTNPLWVTPATGATFVLGTGSAIAGKVGIDQTTLGTTNAISVSQINGVTTLAGNGATGTGALRVSIANDSTGIVALPAAGTSVVGTKAAGTAAATSVLTGAVYNSTTPTLTDGQQAAKQADTTGAVRVSTEGGKTTYSASAGLSVAASASDIFTITGSASKTVRVTRVQISGTATAAVTVPIALVKRSTANTGGTSAASNIIPHDSANTVASATVLYYTANPTTGTLVGIMRQQYMTFSTGTSSAVDASVSIFDFGVRNGQAVVLRGTAQVLAVSLLGTTVTGGLVTVDIEWTEE